MLEQVYQVYETPLFVVSECPPLSHHIHTFCKNLGVRDIPPFARVTVFQTGFGEDSGGVQVNCPELGWMQAAKSVNEGWIAFRRLLLQFILDRERPDVLFHASTVCDERGGAGIIMGASGAGKTTATVGLLQAGLSLVADEYTSVSLDTRQICSFPSGMSVSDDTVRLFPELEPSLHKHCRFRDTNGAQWTVDLSELYSVRGLNTFAEPACVFILFPAFGEKTRVEPCTHGEAIWFLQDGFYPRRRRPLWARTNPQEYHRRCFALVDHLAQRTRVYKVFNGKIQDTIAVMAAALRGEQPALGGARTTVSVSSSACS